MKYAKIIVLLLTMILILTACGARSTNVETPVVEEASSAAPESSVAEPEEPVEGSQSEEASSVPTPPESSSESAPEEPERSSTPESSSSEPTAEPESTPEPETEQESEEEESEPDPEPEPVVPAAIRPEYLGVGYPSLTGDSTYLGDVEEEVLYYINLEREDVGASDVQWDDNLADAARIRVAEMLKNEYTAHTRPNGDSWSTVLKIDVPVGHTAAGEILASIQTQSNEYKIYDPEYWVGQWVNSSSHYACMIKGEYTHAGVAVVHSYDEETGLYYGYACTLFAKW